MVSNKILLIGGGGHCASVLDSLRRADFYDEIGIIDSKETMQPLMDIQIVGTDDELPLLYQKGWKNAFITLGSVGNTTVRRRLYNLLQGIGFHIPNIVDPTAVLAQDIQLGQGVFVGKRAIVNARTQVGDCAIINSGAIVEHDCNIGAFVHISPGAILCGGVHVGEDSHIGAGSVVRQQVTIESKVLVGCGSNVVKPLAAGTVAYGNPCKVVNQK